MTQEMPLRPTTTLQQDMTAAGQRRINLVWEVTQSVIAIIISLSVVFCAMEKIQSEVLTNAFFLIVSMYFVRTNHSIIGGVGPKPPGETR